MAQIDQPSSEHLIPVSVVQCGHNVYPVFDEYQLSIARSNNSRFVMYEKVVSVVQLTFK